MLARRIFATVLLLASASSAWADDNEAAREALRSGRYDTVLALTEQVAAKEPGSAINWYRMAIAAARTGKLPLAAMSLSNARLHDPSLAFASSPARVSALQEQIDRGEGANADPEQLRLDAMELFRLELAPVPTPAIQVKSNDDSDKELLAKLDLLSSKIDSVGKDVAKSKSWWLAVVQPWVLGFVSLCFLLGIGLAAFIDRRAKAISRTRMSNLSRMPLSEMLAFNRDHTEMLRQRLAHHGKQDTALMQAMQRYLPCVELEAGRSQVALTSFPKGKLMIDDTLPMEPAQRVLGKDTAESVHTAALRHFRSQSSKQSDKRLAA